MLTVLEILAALVLFGMALVLLDWIEQTHIQRGRQREWAEYRAAIEEQQAELWPVRLQRSVYDQEHDHAA